MIIFACKQKAIFIFCLQVKKVDLFKMISTLRKWHSRSSLKDLLQSIKKKAIGINIAFVLEVDCKNYGLVKSL